MRTAVFWIQDGVLLERMHINSVAFAAASLAFGRGSLTELVNFGFATSGLSAAEKMQLFNHRHGPAIDDIAAASALYNEIATRASAHCRYFPGLIALIERCPYLHFITSAVEQEVLDIWLDGPQGQLIAPYLTEVLGRGHISKGRGHFAYVQEHYQVERFIYIADAISEISSGRELADEFNIRTIGFANVIQPSAVKEAWELIKSICISVLPEDLCRLNLCQADLELPDQDALTTALRAAGADHVVTPAMTDKLATLLAADDQFS